MGKKERIIEKWKKGLPSDVPFNDVLTVIEGCFEKIDYKKSSHIIIRHYKLNNVAGFGPEGLLTIAVYKGQKVKRIYLKKLLEAIEIIEGDY